MKRIFAAFAVILLMCILALSASASETSSLFRAEVISPPENRGGSFTVHISPADDDIAAFLVKAEYDAGSVESITSKLSKSSADDYLTAITEDGYISLIYTAADGSMAQDGGISLTVKTVKEFSGDSADIKLTFSQIANSSAENMTDSPEIHSVAAPLPALPSSSSALTSLTPPCGTLEPEFDPDIFEYTLSVPYSYTSLIFDAAPIQGASVKVNRKNLGSGGSTSEFRFTVTAADGDTKSVYTVFVTRLTKSDPKNSSISVSSGNGGSKASSAGNTSTINGKVTYITGEDDTASGSAPAAVYVYPQSSDSMTVDRLLTAAIVLCSVAFGVLIAAVLQRSTDKNKDKQ